MLKLLGGAMALPVVMVVTFTIRPASSERTGFATVPTAVAKFVGGAGIAASNHHFLDHARGLREVLSGGLAPGRSVQVSPSVEERHAVGEVGEEQVDLARHGAGRRTEVVHPVLACGAEGQKRGVGVPR